MPSKSGSPDKARWEALFSYADGLYTEMDKLARKAPRESISDLAMTRVNRAIKEARAIAGPFDVYASDLAEFVAAGENAEVRDAVLVLGEIRSALERIRVTHQLGYRR
jgi:hypothetical protein